VGAEIYLHAFLTLALDGGEWSASCPRCFTPSNHWVGEWVGPSASLDVMVRRKIPSLPLPGIEPLLSCL